MKKLSLFTAALTLGSVTVSQAAILDLSSESTVAVSTSYGTAIFTTNFERPAGTGVFQPFLTIQANGTQQGYNTSARRGVFDTKREPLFNREIRVQDMAKTSFAGAEYYSFLIDVNEPNGGGRSLISLDSLKIFTTTEAGQRTTDVESLGTKRFDLDQPSDNTLLYNDRNSGSGQGDIAFFIPVSAFIGACPTDYVYMYQRWGGHVDGKTDYKSGGGFEETAVGYCVVPIPEVSSVLPLALVLGGVIGARRLRLRRAEAEA